MIAINFNNAQLKLKTIEAVTYIFDSNRKKWLVLTPEEWVRQHVLYFFMEHCNYPKKFIAVEKQIKVNKLLKRFDILVSNSQLKPWLIVECKEPNTPINDAVLQQLLNYQTVLEAQYLLLTNGQNSFLFKILPNRQIEVATEWPLWV